jgi:hypothetical protein
LGDNLLGQGIFFENTLTFGCKNKACKKQASFIFVNKKPAGLRAAGSPFFERRKYRGKTYLLT